MTARRFFLWFARIALVALPVTMGFAGCSRQSEGDRCNQAAAGDTDCNEGLRCIACIDLAKGSIDRCCPPNAADASDPGCRRADPPRTGDAALECNPSTGGTGGRGSGGSGTGGNAGLGGASAGSGGTSNGEAGAADSGAGGA